MTVAFVQKSAQLFADASGSISPSLAGCTAGNLVVLVVASSQPSSTTTAIATPSGWTAAVNPSGSAAGGYGAVVAVFYKEGISGGTHSATVTVAANSYSAATIVEFSGVVAAGALDTSNSSTGTGATSANSGAASNTRADAVAIAVVRPEDGVGAIASLSSPATTGYTSIDTQPNNATHGAHEFSYKLLSSKASQSAAWTWTTSGAQSSAIALFVGPDPTPVYLDPKFRPRRVSRAKTYADSGAAWFDPGMDGAGLFDRDMVVAVAGGTPTGVAAEADTALAAAGVQQRAVGLSTEADTALAAAGVQQRAVGLSTEADLASALAPASGSAAGAALEADAALALTGLQLRPVGPGVEADAALALTGLQLRPVGPGVEADAALALTGLQIAAVGRASAADQAFALLAVQKLLAGLALEGDEALGLAPGYTAGPHEVFQEASPIVTRVDAASEIAGQIDRASPITTELTLASPIELEQA